MLPTAMAASQAIASDKKSCLQRLMIDICSSGFLLSNGNSLGAVETGQTLHEVYVRNGSCKKKRPPKKRVAGAWEMSRRSKEWAVREAGN
ncbi:hypothetical protein [Pseudomonas fluorescens]|uniref:hypothetical protein n=1 Tax=Pseudomonas fluorescens TaxID=294 RepID=UPI00177C9E9F|nr:hypothetical protein [Pseudomonas fluorescens]